jgi:hypothetical protein
MLNLYSIPTENLPPVVTMRFGSNLRNTYLRQEWGYHCVPYDERKKQSCRFGHSILLNGRVTPAVTTNLMARKQGSNNKSVGPEQYQGIIGRVLRLLGGAIEGWDRSVSLTNKQMCELAYLPQWAWLSDKGPKDKAVLAGIPSYIQDWADLYSLTVQVRTKVLTESLLDSRYTLVKPGRWGNESARLASEAGVSTGIVELCKREGLSLTRITTRNSKTNRGITR